MILLVHLLLGAVIGSVVKNIPLAIILAFLGHYFLDLFPHAEYGLKNLVGRHWKKSLPDFLKVSLDLMVGLFLIFIFSKNYPIIYICAAIAILPDGLSLLSLIFPSKLSVAHDDLHQTKIHFLKNKEISFSWRILSQVSVVVISIILLGR